MAEVSHVELSRTLYGHSSDVTSVEFCGHLLATCSSDKTVRLWSFDTTPDEVWELPHSPLLGHKYTVHCCCFSPKDPILVTCSTDGHIFFWNVLNGEQESSLKHPGGLGVRVCTISPNGVLLGTAGDDDTVVIWDMNTRSLLRSLEGHEATVNACTFSPDSAYLVSGSNNCDLAVWDARYGGTKWLCRTLEAHDLGVACATFSPSHVVSNDDEKGASEASACYLLATCGNDSIVRLWHVQTGDEVTITQQHELRGHSANVWSCRFSHDGLLLASTAGDKSVIIWDPIQGAILQRLDRHARYVTCCAFSSNDQYLASGSNDKTVIIWKLYRDGKGFAAPLEHHPRVYNHAGPSVLPLRALPQHKDSNAPDEYFCPITHELMKDPVIAADGFTYERSAIAEWLQSGRDTSPMTNHRLPHMQLTANLVLRILIQKHVETDK